MAIIILHNPHDAASRKVVEDALKDDPTIQVIDWYNPEERAKYLKLGGTLAISALPSVVVMPDKGKVDASKDLIRLPENWQTAKQKSIEIEAKRK